MFGRMKDPVVGTAQLVSYEETDFRNEFDTTILAQVIVEGDGVQPTAVESRIGVPNSQLPLDSGTTWQVQFERDNPKHFKTIEPDAQTAAADHTAAQQEAEQLAAQMRAAAAAGTTVPATGFGTAGMPQVIVTGNADPARVAEALGKVQQMFGIDLSGVAAAAGQAATGATTPASAPASTPAPAPAAAADDVVSQLERLAKLHETGVLTDDEFATQKQRILNA
jgi:hypothetical protein